MDGAVDKLSAGSAALAPSPNGPVLRLLSQIPSDENVVGYMRFAGDPERASECSFSPSIVSGNPGF
jgi:hypothetical protein